MSLIVISVGLKRAADLCLPSLDIQGDSQLILRQLSGEYNVKDFKLKKLHSIAKNLISSIPSTRFNYIPRNLNSQADRLANIAMDTKSNYSDSQVEILKQETIAPISDKIASKVDEIENDRKYVVPIMITCENTSYVLLEHSNDNYSKYLKFKSFHYPSNVSSNVAKRVENDISKLMKHLRLPHKNNLCNALTFEELILAGSRNFEDTMVSENSVVDKTRDGPALSTEDELRSETTGSAFLVNGVVIDIKSETAKKVISKLKISEKTIVGPGIINGNNSLTKDNEVNAIPQKKIAQDINETPNYVMGSKGVVVVPIYSLSQVQYALF